MELNKQNNWQAQKTYKNSQMKTYVVIKRLGHHRSIKYFSFLFLIWDRKLITGCWFDKSWYSRLHIHTGTPLLYSSFEKSGVAQNMKYHDSPSFFARRRLWHAFVKLTTDFIIKIYETDVAKDQIGQMNMQFITWIFVPSQFCRNHASGHSSELIYNNKRDGTGLIIICFFRFFQDSWIFKHEIRVMMFKKF